MEASLVSIVIVGERQLQSNENFPARYKLNSHTSDIGELTQPGNEICSGIKLWLPESRCWRPSLYDVTSHVSLAQLFER